MRSFLLLTIVTLASLTGIAQNPSAPVAPDSTIYDFPDAPAVPLVASCMKNQSADWTRDSMRRCANAQLLAILSGNIRYPEEARHNNVQGTVVMTYVVGADGRISGIRLLKDIGGGCGQEAIRVLQAMIDAGLHYLPGAKGDKPVRTRETLPMRFKLEEPLPYYISATRDTIYTSLSTAPVFKGGSDSLAKFAANQLQYPKGRESSCKTGMMELSLLIRSDGAVKIDNILDFSNLGLDYQWEADRMARRTFGMWSPGTYQGKAVTSSQALRVVFESDNPVCKSVNQQFEKAILMANEGADLLDKKQMEAAIVKWTDALVIQPENTEWLYYRGTALLNLNRRDDACKDFTRIKEILGITWFEKMRKLICGY